MATDSLSPTYEGWIDTTFDSLLVFEACLSGQFNLVSRRPFKEERDELIKSGAVFIYKHGSPIKRWGDGKSWTPSRTSGAFLIYHELPKLPQRGGRRNLIKRDREDADKRNQSSGSVDKALSLVDSYECKKGGLVKKCTKVNVRDGTYNLVSYHTLSDVNGGKLSRPAQDPFFPLVHPRDEITKDHMSDPSVEASLWYRAILHDSHRAPLPTRHMDPHLTSIPYAMEGSPKYSTGLSIVQAAGAPRFPIHTGSGNIFPPGFHQYTPLATEAEVDGQNQHQYTSHTGLDGMRWAIR